jgi:hypothetical protein
MFPNLEELIECINLMAGNMSFEILPKKELLGLINHVLFDEHIGQVSGKEAWACLMDNLITERELRNLMMAHSATKLAGFNKKDEPFLSSYLTEDLCHKFDKALFGKIIQSKISEPLDSWDKNL